MKMQNSTLEATTDHDSLYGLRVIKYNYSSIKLPETEEEWNTLIDLVIQATRTCMTEVNNEVSNLTNDPTLSSVDEIPCCSSLRKLAKLMKEECDELKKLRKSLEVRYNARMKRIERENAEDTTETALKIEQFFVDFRGLLLTVYHNIEMAIKTIHDSQEKRAKKHRKLLRNPFASHYSFVDYEGQIEKHNRKHHVFLVLLRTSNIISKERENNCCDCFFPFSNSIDITQYKEITSLNTADIMADLGTQFVPMLQRFFSLMVKVTASYSNSLAWSSKHPFVKQGAFAMSNLYYIMNASAAANQTSKFFSSVTSSSGRDLWELQDAGMLKPFMYLSMPYVDVSSTFSIPSFYEGSGMTDKEFHRSMFSKLWHRSKSSTLLSAEEYEGLTPTTPTTPTTPGSPVPLVDEQEYIQHAETEMKNLDEATPALLDNMEKDLEENHDMDTKKLKDPAPEPVDCDALEGRIAMPEYKKFYGALTGYDSYSAYKTHNIMLRLISTKPLMNSLSDVTKEFPYLAKAAKLLNRAKYYMPTSWRGGETAPVDPKPPKQHHHPHLHRRKSYNAPANDLNGVLVAKSPVRPSKSLIFHIHGGGFIAMSSRSYLRHWALETGLPVISVDYSKAPESRFPVALEECFTAYKWVIKNAVKLLGAPLKKIICAGDSAGGNLCLALTLKCIQEGERMPDALALSYPATYIYTSPSPARMVSLIDPLVNFSFLTMCGANYTDTYHDQKRDPFISPCVAPDEMLAKFPPTYINVGALDPLFDDGVYMARRIAKNNGGKVKLEVIDGMGHGYLNLADFVPEAKAASTRLAKFIKDIESDNSQISQHAEVQVTMIEAKDEDLPAFAEPTLLTSNS